MNWLWLLMVVTGFCDLTLVSRTQFWLYSFCSIMDRSNTLKNTVHLFVFIYFRFIFLLRWQNVMHTSQQ